MAAKDKNGYPLKRGDLVTVYAHVNDKGEHDTKAAGVVLNADEKTGTITVAYLNFVELPSPLGVGQFWEGFRLADGYVADNLGAACVRQDYLMPEYVEKI